MNKKTLITALGLGIVLLVTIVLAIFDSRSVKAELTDYDVCYGSGMSFEQQVTACGNLIKLYDNYYEIYSGQLFDINEEIKANSNDKKKAQEAIKKYTKDFFSKSLSGTNVNFMTTK